MTYQEEINVLDIYLDSENPRHNPITDQIKIIETLVKKEKIKRLAKDIADIGISPIETIAVFKSESGQYVAIEGNRRLCALMLLIDPDKNSANSDYFRRLASASKKIPTKITCTIFDSREEADVWIERKHQGEQDGIGTRSWNTKAKDRHYARKEQGSKNALAIALIDHAATLGYIDKEHEARIVTTAQRYLGNPYFRQTMGIVSSRTDPNVKINAEREGFNAALKVFINDLLENKKVTSRSKKTDWEDYAQELVKAGIAPKRSQTARFLSGSATSGGEDEGAIEDDDQKSARSSQRHNRHPDKRISIVPSDFRVPIKDKILKRCFEEMRALKVDETPLAVAVVTRAFLENLYELYHEKARGYYKHFEKTHVLLDEVIKLLEEESLSKQEKNALQALRRVKSNDTHAFSPKNLGANAHAGIYPTPTDLKIEFNNVESILLYMLGKI